MEHVKCEATLGNNACSSDTQDDVKQTECPGSTFIYRTFKAMTLEKDETDAERVVDTTEEDISVDMSSIKKDPNSKPGLSYIALISMAIQSSSEKRMLLSEIYQWITENFPYYKSQDRSWRNSIRHNLSLNECFVKSGRSENGKGNYWSIHVANMDDFDQGDYRRRHARSRVRKCEEEVRKLNTALSSDEPIRSDVPEPSSPVSTPEFSAQYSSYGPGGYVPMTSTIMPTDVLISTFGVDAILTKEEQLQRFRQPSHHSTVVQSSHHSTAVQPSHLSALVQSSHNSTVVQSSNFSNVLIPISSSTASYPTPSGHYSSLLSNGYNFPSLLPLSATENTQMITFT